MTASAGPNEAPRIGVELTTGAKYSVVDRIEREGQDGTRVRKDTITDVEVLDGGRVGEGELRLRSRLVSIRHAQSDAVERRSFDSDIQKPRTQWQRAQAIALGVDVETTLSGSEAVALTVDEHALERRVAKLHLQGEAARGAGAAARTSAVTPDPAVSLALLGFDEAAAEWTYDGTRMGRDTFKARVDLAGTGDVVRGHCTLIVQQHAETGAPAKTEAHCVATLANGQGSKLDHVREWTPTEAV